MSIPLVWDEVLWRKEWGLYRDRDLSGHAIVDGGMLSNFPLELFISGEPQVTKVMGPKQANPVLGLMIDEALEVPVAARGVLVNSSVKPADLALVQRIGRLIDTATTAHDKRVIEEHGTMIVRLPAKGYGTTEFDMSEERRKALVKAGRDAMALYFDTPTGFVLPSKGTLPGVRASTPADRIGTSVLERGQVQEAERLR
jgi:predicted acylesterase/phospholipase RssA